MREKKTPPHYRRLLLIALFAAVVITGSFFTAKYIGASGAAQVTMTHFGYFGVVILGIISGLNFFIPVPAATFVPVFTAAGLSLPGIILGLVGGTLIADYIGYLFGNLSRPFLVHKYPKIIALIDRIKTTHRAWLLPFLGLYAAVFPFPNEAVILPLALIGIRFRHMFIPLAIGNMINQTVLVYGFDSLFSVLFL